MRALILGGEGQLGRALAATAPAGIEVVSLGRTALDITDEAAVSRVFDTVKPLIVFNAAAYTAVDGAESDEDTAYAVNATAVGLLAALSRMAENARFVHVSTDFVFDGTQGSPYRPDAPTNPLGAYGRTKLAGEKFALGLGEGDTIVVRTSWVYAPTGSNFVRTMLRLMRERPEVRVVADQIGTPTFAPGLAAALWSLSGRGFCGIQHYTDAGVASWYDFAVAIQEEALAAGLLTRAVPVIPIAAADYPTPAERPAYSVLDKTATYAALGAPAPHWRENLRAMIAGLAANG